MITPEVIRGMWKRLNDAISSVDVSCDEHTKHTIPLDVRRGRVRFHLTTGKDGKQHTDGNLPQISRIVLDTSVIARKKYSFLGNRVEKDGKFYNGDWRESVVAIHFLATDWHDLFGSDVAWQMAGDTEGLLFDENGIWDEYLEENDAAIFKKSYDPLVNGIVTNYGIENLYQVTLGFLITDQRIFVNKNRTPVEDAAIEHIHSEVSSR